MSNVELEERLVRLETLVGQLLEKRNGRRGDKDWRRSIGMFDGDPIMEEIIEAGREIREDDRKRTSE